MHGKRKAMAGVNVNYVEARTPRAQCRFSVPTPVASNVGFGHTASLRRSVTRRIYAMARSKGDLARVKVRSMQACVDQFDRGQRTVFMYGVRHESERRNVAVIPQSTFDVRRDIAR